MAAIEQFGADFGSAGGTRERPDGRGKHVQMRLLPGRAEELDLTTDFWRIARKFRPMVPYAAVMRKSMFDDIGGFWEPCAPARTRACGSTCGCAAASRS